jgi:hypothetical protein
MTAGVKLAVSQKGPTHFDGEVESFPGAGLPPADPDTPDSTELDPVLRVSRVGSCIRTKKALTIHPAPLYISARECSKRWCGVRW